jgi:hypothetical protein
MYNQYLHTNNINIYDIINKNNICNKKYNDDVVEICKILINDVKIDNLTQDIVPDLEDKLDDDDLDDEDLDVGWITEYNKDIQKVDYEFDQELDIKWISEYNKIFMDYNIFYNTTPNFVNSFFLYIDLSLNLIFIDKNKININNGCFYKENIIPFVNNKKKYNGCFYKLDSVLKFNINFDLEQFIKYDINNTKNTNDIYHADFVTLYSFNNIYDIIFEKTIQYLHNTNSLFFIMLQFKKSKNKTIKNYKNYRNVKKYTRKKI